MKLNNHAKKLSNKINNWIHSRKSLFCESVQESIKTSTFIKLREIYEGTNPLKMSKNLVKESGTVKPNHVKAMKDQDKRNNYTRNIMIRWKDEWTLYLKLILWLGKVRQNSGSQELDV